MTKWRPYKYVAIPRRDYATIFQACRLSTSGIALLLGNSKAGPQEFPGNLSLFINCFIEADGRVGSVRGEEGRCTPCRMGIISGTYRNKLFAYSTFMTGIQKVVVEITVMCIII